MNMFKQENLKTRTKTNFDALLNEKRFCFLLV